MGQEAPFMTIPKMLIRESKTIQVINLVEAEITNHSRGNTLMRRTIKAQTENLTNHLVQTDLMVQNKIAKTLLEMTVPPPGGNQTYQIHPKTMIVCQISLMMISRANLRIEGARICLPTTRAMDIILETKTLNNEATKDHQTIRTEGIPKAQTMMIPTRLTTQGQEAEFQINLSQIPTTITLKKNASNLGKMPETIHLRMMEGDIQICQEIQGKIKKVQTEGNQRYQKMDESKADPLTVMIKTPKTTQKELEGTMTEGKMEKLAQIRKILKRVTTMRMRVMMEVVQGKTVPREKAFSRKKMQIPQESEKTRGQREWSFVRT
jgi:hypothetical protein